MPTDTWQNLTPCLELLRAWMPGSVLDVGCGFGRWGLLCREFLDVWEGRPERSSWQTRIDGIESDPRAVGAWQRTIYDTVHVGDPSEVLPDLGTYDLILVDGLLERLDPEAGRRLLGELLRHRSDRGRILVHVRQKDAADRRDAVDWIAELEETGFASTFVDHDRHGARYATLVLTGATDPVSSPDAPGARLRIAFPCLEYPTEHNATVGGGIGTYVRNLARWLAGRGHDVHVLLSHRPGEPRQFVDAAVQLHNLDLPAPNIKDPRSIQAYSRTVAERLAELERERPFDVVHFSEWAAEGWAYRPGPETVVSVKLLTPSHVIWDFEYHDGTPDEYRVSDLERWLPERADLVLSPSVHITRRIAENWSLDPEQVLHSPLPLDLESYDRTIAGATDPVDENLVVCVNRLTPLKGPQVLIGAARRVLDQFPAARFRFVGRGAPWGNRSAEEHLRDLARERGVPGDRVEFAGARTREEMPSELRRAAVCVNPSRIESYSYTSAEALASGRPLVLTDQQGISEYLTSGEDCLIVPADDEEKLAEAICALLSSPEQAETIGRAGRRTMESRLATGPVLEEIETTFLAARRRTVPTTVPTRLHIGIVAGSDRPTLTRCLDSLRENTTQPFNLHLLHDGTEDWLRSIEDPTTHVHVSDASGTGAAGRNELLRAILPSVPRDGFVIFLDPDVEVEAGWADPFLEAFESRPRAGVAGTGGSGLLVRNQALELFPAPADSARVDVIDGPVTWIRGEAAWRIGAFDDRAAEPGGERDDYCVRCAAHGYTVVRVDTNRIRQTAPGPDRPAWIRRADLAERWQQHGWVDAEGRVPRIFSAPDVTAELLSRICRATSRPEVPEAELAEATRQLEILLSSPDSLREFAADRYPVSPTLRALLELSIETAGPADPELSERLQAIASVLDEHGYARVLAPHVVRTAAADRPRAGVRLNKLCEAEDWHDPEWIEIAESWLGAGDSRNYYRRHRQTWEYVQLAYGLRKLGALHEEARGLSVGAGAEQLMFALSGKVEHLTAVDLYDARATEAFGVPGDLVDHPERHAVVPFAADRLTFRRMDALALDFPDDSFDFAYCAAALHHFGGQEQAVRALSEMGRVVRPGGIVAFSTDIILNGASDGHRFRPDEIESRLVAPAGLRSIEQMDLSQSDGTLEGFGDRPETYSRLPHFLLCVGRCVLGSGTVFLEKKTAPREEAPPGRPDAYRLA